MIKYTRKDIPTSERLIDSKKLYDSSAKSTDDKVYILDNHESGEMYQIIIEKIKAV